jgi:hypothetical protein
MLNGTPGPRVALSPLMSLGAALPKCWWNPGLAWVWKESDAYLGGYDTRESPYTVMGL